MVADRWQRRASARGWPARCSTWRSARGARLVRLHALADNDRVGRLVRRTWPGRVPRRDGPVLAWDLPLAGLEAADSRPGPPPGRGRRRTRSGPGRGQISETPYAPSASVTGWKKDWKPAPQPPIVPPEVIPIAVLPENQEPPLSPGWVQALVCTMP